MASWEPAFSASLSQEKKKERAKLIFFMHKLNKCLCLNPWVTFTLLNWEQTNLQHQLYDSLINYK